MQAIWWSCGCHCCRSSWNMPQWTWMHIVLFFPLENNAGESCGIQGQTYLGRGLPPPPPRATLRSVVFGQQLVYRSFGRSDLMAPLGPEIKLSNQLSPGIMQDFWKKELLGQGQMWKSTETSLKPLWCVTASGLFSSNKMLPRANHVALNLPQLQRSWFLAGSRITCERLPHRFHW